LGPIRQRPEVEYHAEVALGRWSPWSGVIDLPTALNACRLLGKPLPLTGYFDKKRLLFFLGSFARLLKAFHYISVVSSRLAWTPRSKRFGYCSR
jgi:hypothetical protein